MFSEGQSQSISVIYFPPRILVGPGFSSVAVNYKRARMFYLDHVETDGRLLFEEVVKMDLEGIVCKRKDSPYKVTEKPSRYWIKVKNSRYSQLEGRKELFERG